MIELEKRKSLLNKTTWKMGVSFMLKLYGTNKQIEVGDINEKKPSFFKVTERLKWNSWEKYKGMDRYTAIFKFNELVREIK